MKRLLLLIAILSFGFFAQAQVSILPQVGLNLTRYNSDPPPFTQRARVGLNFGAHLRFGKRVFIQPGVVFLRQRVEFEQIQFPLPPVPNKDQINLNSVMLSAVAGVNIIQSDLFRVRLMGGATGTYVTAVSPNKLSLTIDDYQNLWYGLRGGLGFDILIFTLDLNYDHGIIDALLDRESKIRMLSASAGIRITFSD